MFVKFVKISEIRFLLVHHSKVSEKTNLYYLLTINYFSIFARF